LSNLTGPAKQRCLLQIGGIQPLGEPGIQVSQLLIRRRERGRRTLCLPQAAQTHRRSQFPRLCDLRPRHRDGTLEARGSLCRTTERAHGLFLEADLNVSLARNGSGDVVTGDLISYTVTITNSGPVSITSALLTFNFSPADTVGWAGRPSCQWNSGTEVMTCTASLAGLSPTSLEVAARTVNWEGVFRNTVSVAPPADIVDPDALDNVARPVTVVVNRRYLIYLPIVLKEG
jgi:hypothetical protein